MLVDPVVTLSSLRSEYRAACLASDEILSSIGDLDALVIRSGQRRNLRWAVLNVLMEAARHAGHADIVREQIDGKTGQ